jgi:endo-1,4-beta-D-glucanase Y
MKLRDHLPKVLVLAGIFVLYIIIGSILLVLVNTGVIPRAPLPPADVDLGTDSGPVPTRINPADTLDSAISYLDTNLRRSNGHIDQYKKFYERQNITQHNHTNSEAVSYYLQIMAQQGNKSAFDSQLDYMMEKMIHPTGGYLMWRLDDNDAADPEGENNAPDADLRAIHALYVAKDRWGDQKYDEAIDRLAQGLERIAIKDGVLVAYGGMSGPNPWLADESYLAYSDFQVFERLANTRGGPWVDVSKNMRNITLEAQIWNGLYNSVYFLDASQHGDSRYGTHIDGGVYSINSLWIMVRFAESNDKRLMESAQKSLDFYKERYRQDGRIYTAYDSKGEPTTNGESPWAYALVARAAAALGDDSFANIMERHMRDFQDLTVGSPHYGAFIEGALGDERVGQFTMQESILALQEINGIAPRVNE